MVGTILFLFAAFAIAPVTQAPKADSPVSIFARLELAVQGGPRGLVQTDIDGDGADELVVITEFPGRILIWRDLQPGFAALAQPLTAEIPDYCIGPEILRDSTLVLASRIDRELLLVPLTSNIFESENTGAGTTTSFAPEITRIALDSIPRAVAVDSSGATERIAVVTEAPELFIISAGEIESRTPLTDILPTAVAFAQGGVVVASQGAPSLVFYRAPRESAAPFAAGKSLPLSGIPRDLAVLDLDKDGDEELVCLLGARTAHVLGMQFESGLAPWFEGADDLPAAIDWTTGALPIDLTTFDLTSSGFEELIATHLSDQIVSVLGDFTAAGPAQSNGLHGGAGPWRSEIGDLNGDGHPDLAVANPQGAAISLFFGSASNQQFGGFQGAPHFQAVPVPHSMTAGDFNGDGRDDVALLSAWDNSMGILYGAAGASPSFEPLQTIDVPPESDELATGDVNGDGIDDILLLEQTPAGTRLVALSLSEHDNKQFTRFSSEAGSCREGAGLLAIDFDGDGRDEVLVADAAGHKLIAYGLDPTGKFAVLATLLLDAAPGCLAPIFDAPKPGKPARLKGVALALLGDKGAGVGLLSIASKEQAKDKLISGSAPFALVGVLPAPRPVQDIVGADMDGDGFTDIAILMQGATDNQPGGVLISLAPNANGRTSWRHMPPLFAGPKAYHLLARDLNGDRAAELFVSSQYAYRVDSWVGVPGQIPAPSWRLGAHRGCMDMAFADINGDGVIELIVANNHSSDVSVLRLEVTTR